MRLIRCIRVVVGTATAGLLVSVAPAFAHVTANPREATADGFTYHAFRIGHGCDGSPTAKVAIQIPDGVVSVKPQEVAGWEITITEGPYEESVELHGDTLTEGVKEVSWTGGPLPDNHMQQFGLSMKMPDKAGETIYFPVVQSCEQGVHRWITIPVEGQDEPEEPAPGVKLLPKAEEAGGDAGATQSNTPGDEKPVAGASDEATGAEPVARAGQVQDDDNKGLAVVALVVGIAGLLTGGAAFFRKRS